MKKLDELSEGEIALRSLIYAIETKDQVNPNHPFPMGNAYLQHQVTEARAVAEKLGIPLVDSVTPPKKRGE